MAIRARSNPPGNDNGPADGFICVKHSPIPPHGDATCSSLTLSGA